MTPFPPPPPDFAARRARYLSSLGAHASLLFAPPLRGQHKSPRYKVPSDLYYLTGWPQPEAAALFRPGADQPFILFVPPNDPHTERWEGRRPGLRGAEEIFGADLALPLSTLSARLGELLQGYEVLEVGFGVDAEREATVVADVQRLARVAGRNGLEVPWQLWDARRRIGEMRVRKEPEEIARLRRAAQISSEAHRRAMAMGRPGVNEAQVEATLEHAFRMLGCSGPGYGTIVGGGDNACILHYVQNDAPLRAGTLCLVDAGGEFEGYTADITRTWPVSGRFSGPQADLYALVLAAQAAAIAQARPGVPYAAMHQAALEVLTQGMIDLGILHGDRDLLLHEEGWKKHYMHGTGHFLGLDVHDAGLYFQGLASRPLAPGMVVTVEPGLYFDADDEEVPAAFRGIGIRIEDDLLITTDAPEILTLDCPKTIAEIEAITAAG